MGIVQDVRPKKKDSPDHPDPTPSLEKKDVLRQAYYKYAREDEHHPESYRVFKTLYERHIEGKHKPFQRYVIPPKNDKRLKTIKSYTSYSRAIVQDARRSKFISMLNNVSNPRSPCLFSNKETSLF